MSTDPGVKVGVYFTDPTAGGGRSCREIVMTLAELPRIGETLVSALGSSSSLSPRDVRHLTQVTVARGSVVNSAWDRLLGVDYV